MKLIIAGSRDITDYQVVRQAVINSGVWREFGQRLEIVCGMARGVDMLGYEFGQNNGLTIHHFPANWRPNGVFDKAAGHKRNRDMGNFADMLLAIWDGKSKGTEGMIKHMRDTLKKPTIVWHTDLGRFE